MADIAAAFQEAVVDVITSKAVLACREHGITDVLLGGEWQPIRGSGS